MKEVKIKFKLNYTIKKIKEIDFVLFWFFLAFFNYIALSQNLCTQFIDKIYKS